MQRKSKGKAEEKLWKIEGEAKEKQRENKETQAETKELQRKSQDKQAKLKENQRKSN